MLKTQTNKGGDEMPDPIPDTQVISDETIEDKPCFTSSTNF